MMAEGVLLEFSPGIPLVQVVAPVTAHTFFFILGVFQGMKGSGRDRGIDLSGLVVMCGYSGNFGRCPPVLERGSCWGLNFLSF